MNTHRTPMVPTGPGPYWDLFFNVYTGRPVVDMYLAQLLAHLQHWKIAAYHVAETVPRRADRSGLIGLDGHDEALFVMANEELGSDIMVSRSTGGEHRIRLDQIEIWHLEQKHWAGNLSKEEQRVYNERRGWL